MAEVGENEDRRPPISLHSERELHGFLSRTTTFNPGGGVGLSDCEEFILMRMYEKTPGMLTLALTFPLRLFRPVDGNLSRTVDETKQTISDPTSYYRILYACWEHSTFRYCTRTER